MLEAYTVRHSRLPPLSRNLLLEELTAGIFVKARNSYIPSHAPGVADILGIMKDGRLLAIEVKSPTGRLSPHQQTFLGETTARGGLTFVARSVEETEQRLAEAVRGVRG
jgi:predicted RecB family endonuclease